MQPLMGRTFKVEVPIRCDYCNKIIERGKVATKVYGDQSVKAQGTFHGARCYAAARAHYEALEKKVKKT